MDPQTEKKHLSRAIEKIVEIARGFNLDFYNMHFEICPAEIIYSFGAYGTPTRFSHWSFGKGYHKMKTHHDYNLSRIYELVINSNPCYAFLLEGNSLVQNKMVAAHVVAHCDFFKNNYYFSRTNRDMVESMSVAAERIRGYEYRYGLEKVESFLDSVMALQDNVDPLGHIGITNDTGIDYHGALACPGHQCAGEQCGCGGGDPGPYDDLWDLDGVRCSGVCKDEAKRFPERPEKDLLMFMARHGRDLEDWQRDIMFIIRDEALYFWPQMQTKIMNEGWATYWHTRIMRQMDLSFGESLEFAKAHAGVIAPSKYRINPYLLGLKIFEDIERKWDHPTVGKKQECDRQDGAGREKIFEVRETENDISFIRNYLTRELVEELDLYLYQKVGYDWKVVERDWEKVRDGLVKKLSNCGLPYILVEDGDFGKRGEIYLRHVHEGTDLDLYYLEKTLPHVYNIWGRPAYLETVVDGKKVLFSYDGDKTSRRYL